MGRVNVRDGFWVLLAALWCVDEDNLLPLFLTAALVHEAGHAAALYLAGGRLRQLTLTALPARSCRPRFPAAVSPARQSVWPGRRLVLR